MKNCFQNEEEFQRIYSECLDDQPHASQAVMDTYKGMRNLFDEYLNAIQEDLFRYAYQCGYQAGLKAAGYKSPAATR